jgi:hypothetical protein
MSHNIYIVADIKDRSIDASLVQRPSDLRHTTSWLGSDWMWGLSLENPLILIGLATVLCWFVRSYYWHRAEGVIQSRLAGYAVYPTPIVSYSSKKFQQSGVPYH